MTYDTPVRIFVSKMVNSVYEFQKYLYYLLVYDLFHTTDQTANNFHLSVLLTLKIFECVSENLELLYLYHLGLDVILSVQDFVN